LSWVDRLSDLAHLVPLDQISVPPEVQAYNDTLEPPGAVTAALRRGPGGDLTTMTGPRPGAVFGVPLADLTGPNAERGLPIVIHDCIAYLESQGLTTEGIFRRSPSSAQLKSTKADYDSGTPVDLDPLGVHVAAVLLKMYFHELPTTVLPVSLYDLVPDMAECITDADRARFIRDHVLPTLDAPGRFVLTHVFRLLHRIAERADSNKMTSHNLAIVWTPNLVRSDNLALDMRMYDPASGATIGGLVRIAIDHYPMVFGADV
ncbi:hypothetical protein IWQ60_010405, partial [Tieghemiomyces parasiticus]